MTPGVLAVVVSGSLLLIVAAVYRVEEARQRRFAERFRTWCDTQLARIATWVTTGVWQQYVKLVQWLGYRMLHMLLKRCVLIARRAVTTLESTLQRNRLKAKQLSHDDSSSYLSSLQKHKQEHMLSERERQQLKRLH